MDIKGNLDRIRHDIQSACLSSGRDPADVKLLAVSKTKGIESVRTAWQAGQHDFGENYLQEALQKTAALPEANWHFIGSIQSNKSASIAKHFDWVHSVASLKVASRLSQSRDPADAPLNCLVQVNLSGESSKSGVNDLALGPLLEEARKLTGISLRGLMTMPEPGVEEAITRERFRQLRDLRDELGQKMNLPAFDQLSMGMSADFRIAIAEGATWIRIGTAVFGDRTTATSRGDQEK